jgi:predicted thioredoxin/glutaredoxin
MEYGIMSTPGVIVDGKIAHAGGIDLCRAKAGFKKITHWAKIGFC